MTGRKRVSHARARERRERIEQMGIRGVATTMRPRGVWAARVGCEEAGKEAAQMKETAVWKRKVWNAGQVAGRRGWGGREAMVSLTDSKKSAGTGGVQAGPADGARASAHCGDRREQPLACDGEKGVYMAGRLRVRRGASTSRGVERTGGEQGSQTPSRGRHGKSDGRSGMGKATMVCLSHPTAGEAGKRVTVGMNWGTTAGDEAWEGNSGAAGRPSMQKYSQRAVSGASSNRVPDRHELGRRGGTENFPAELGSARITSGGPYAAHSRGRPRRARRSRIPHRGGDEIVFVTSTGGGV
ncbi:hypothetical protein EDB89DRAFT_1906530 [Lactarius sanguifluus]|nr:hypothetical protein EDB89DRAFT_1906530 [Lactarius sanguifluus]